jgi:protein O-mannosyl-transferase
MKKPIPSKTSARQGKAAAAPSAPESVKPAWYTQTAFRMKVVLFLFSFVLYGNTMKNGYSLDDLYVTYNNPVVKKGIAAIPQILSSRYINLNAEEGGTMNFGYRPLTKAMFAVEHQLFGENPGMSHLINILLYALTLTLLFSLLRRLMHAYPIWYPFLITMLWAALPVHTEVVASLKNREEILSFLFGLLAWRSFMKYAARNSYLALVSGALWFLLSLFTKPSALPLLAAIPFAIGFFMGTDFKKLALITASMVLISLAAVLFVKFYLPSINRPMLFFENPLAFEKNKLLHISTGMYGLLIYLKLLVFPHPLLFYYGYNTLPVVGFGNGWVLLSLALHLGMFVFAVLKFRERNLLSFAILFYLIVISMYANIVKPPAGIIAERFLYIASLGFCIAVVFLLFRIFGAFSDNTFTLKTRSRVLLVLFVILIPFTARTIVRNKDWNSQLSLFSHDIQYLGNSAKANFIYATTLKTELIEKLKSGDRQGSEAKTDKIIGLLEQTVKVYPGYFEAWNSLGEMYTMMKNDNDKAQQYFERTVKEKPSFAAGWYNLGYIHFQKENFAEALNGFRKASELDSTDLKSLSNLATCYNRNDQLDSAVLTNERIIRSKPQVLIPYLNNASFYFARQDSAQAVVWLEKAAVVKPDNSKISGVLARYFAGKGDKAKAEHYHQLYKNATQGSQP